MPHHVQVVLHDEHRVPRRLEPVQYAEQCLRVGRVQPRRRLVQYVHDPEQPGPQLRGQPEPLQLARRQGRRGAVQAQVAEPELHDGPDAGPQVLGEHPGRLPVRGRGDQYAVQGGQRQRRQLGDRTARERHGQRRRSQPPPRAHRARGIGEEPLGAGAQRGALAVREGPHHIAVGAHVGALVRPLDPVRVPYRVHRDHRLLLGEQDPLAVLRSQLPPGRVHVVPEHLQDVPEVLALPGARPGGDRPLADRQLGVRYEEFLAGAVDAAEAVAGRAGPGRGVGGEGVGVEPFGARRIGSGAGVQHPQGVGQQGHRSDRGP